MTEQQAAHMAEAITERTTSAPRGIIGEGYNCFGDRIAAMILVGPDSIQVIQVLDTDIVADYNLN